MSDRQDVVAVPVIASARAPDTEETPVAADPRAKTYGHHPISMICMGFWIVYVAIMVWLLQYTARIATRKVHPPWYYDWLPSVLLTGFAQGHLPITAMYLARLGLSALHDSNTTPRSWAELFWLADRRWQSPMGMGGTLFDRYKFKTRLSSTFALFAVTCLIALPTPIIVSRAWPVFTITVGEPLTLNLDTFYPPLMSSIESASQYSTGEGTWSTGLTVKDVFGSSTYIPANVTDTHNDYFLAGDVSGTDVTLPGIRVQGGCSELPNSPAPPANLSSFSSWCLSFMPDMQPSNEIDISNSNGDVQQLMWCMDYSDQNTTWMNASPAASASALIWFSSTVNGFNTTLYGYISCNTTFATGDAALNGREFTFANFTQVAWYNSSEITPKTGNTLLHPLYAALADISQPFNASNQRGDTIMKALGFQALYNSTTGEIQHLQPTFDTVMTQLWRGASHMGAAIALLSRAQNQTFATTTFTSVSGRVSNIPFVAGGSFLLLAWLLMIVVCTIRLYRPTFGSSLDNYVAARMLADRRDAVEENVWDMRRDSRMIEKFPPVEPHRWDGDSKHNSVVGSPTSPMPAFIP